MKRLIVGLVLFVLAFCGSAFAEVSIKADVDKKSITTDNALTYKIIVTSTENVIYIPQPPDFKGFQPMSQAQSSSFSFVKGQMKREAAYLFILVPIEAGKFKIGPAKLKTKEEVLASEEFEIEVKQGALRPKISPQQNPLPENLLRGTGEPQVTL